jgi:hypothetical protein
MGNTPKYEIQVQDADERDLFALRPEKELASITESQVHVLDKDKGVICRTDYRARPRSPLEIVLDATHGFIPLWEENLVLQWRFNEASVSVFRQPEAVKSKIRELLGAAVMAWGDAAPIRFDENADNSDFEIVVEQFPDCSPQGCVLAEAFFPDAGRHQLLIFPTMFEQDRQEQVDTLTHEIGHVFGLRHFFALEFETGSPAVIFGEHNPESIMNYGRLSELTDADRRDLRLLYEGVWSRQLRKINGTPIKLIRPFHYLFS